MNKKHKTYIIMNTLIVLIIGVHFLKDITQDILGIPTFLDLLGNVDEISCVQNPGTKSVLYSLGYMSFVAELVALVSFGLLQIKRYFDNKILEKIMYGSIIFLAIYFTFAVLIRCN